MPRVRRAPRLAVAVLLVFASVACRSDQGTGLPDDGSLRYRLADVNGKRLPSDLSYEVKLDKVDTTSVIAAALTLQRDSTLLLEATLRYSGGGAPSRTEVVRSLSTYIVAADSLTVCFDCAGLPPGGGYSKFFIRVPFDSAGFTMPLLFSTGNVRAYRYVRR